MIGKAGDVGVFPFGRAVTRRPPSASASRPVFVLGAYPSALHVRWEPPRGSGLRAVQALAVDDEPEPFWAGADELDRIDSWRDTIAWRREWGHASPPSRNLNGPSGSWVDTNVLAPLNATRSDAWITDCLDTYRTSTGMAAAIAAVYAPFAPTWGLPVADVDPHPSETQIVAESTTLHLDRLRRELRHLPPRRHRDARQCRAACDAATRRRATAAHQARR
jgi:hypothetical protein